MKNIKAKKTDNKDSNPTEAPKAPSPRRVRLVRYGLGFVVAFVSLLIAWGVFIFFNTTDSTCRLYIPEGSSRAAVVDSINRVLGPSMGADVNHLWSIFGGDPATAAGYYEVPSSQLAWRVAWRLKRGQQSGIRVTINNVRTLGDLARQVSRKLRCDSAQFVNAADSVLPAAGFADSTQFLAAFLPDTYEFYWATPPARVITKLVKLRDKYWTPQRVAKAKALGLTPVQVATLASIVEEESNIDADRKHIARLYLNRLDKGMRLQADPTVRYALGDFTIRRINNRHLRVQSPYNTYVNDGLPPGPIRLAQPKVMDMVLDAPANDYLYMCASPAFDGTHRFAADYATHQANAREYQRELDRRGIKI